MANVNVSIFDNFLSILMWGITSLSCCNNEKRFKYTHFLHNVFCIPQMHHLMNAFSFFLSHYFPVFLSFSLSHLYTFFAASLWCCHLSLLHWTHYLKKYIVFIRYDAMAFFECTQRSAYILTLDKCIFL